MYNIQSLSRKIVQRLYQDGSGFPTVTAPTLDLCQPTHELVQNVPHRMLQVLLGNEGIYFSVLDSNYFQKNCLCNGGELLFRSMSYVQMQHYPPANPPNRHNNDLCWLLLDLLVWVVLG